MVSPDDRLLQSHDKATRGMALSGKDRPTYGMVCRAG